MRGRASSSGGGRGGRRRYSGCGRGIVESAVILPISKAHVQVISVVAAAAAAVAAMEAVAW